MIIPILFFLFMGVCALIGIMCMFEGNEARGFIFALGILALGLGGVGISNLTF